MARKVAIFWPGDYRAKPNELALPGVTQATEQIEAALRKLGRMPYRVEGFLTRTDPSLVILTAALTNVDYCESHPAETRARNLDQIRPVVTWCAGRDVPLMFFSTDYLFDGAHR